MNQSVKTGIVSGILVVVLAIGYLQIQDNPSLQFLSFIPILVFIGGIYIGIKRTRDKEHGGQIEFKAGLKAGFIVGLICAIFFSVYRFILFTRTDVRAVMMELKQAGYSNSFIVEFLSNVTKQRFFDSALRIAVAYSLMSFLIALAATLFLRRKA